MQNFYKIIIGVFNYIFSNIFVIISTYLNCKKDNSETRPKLHLTILDVTRFRKAKREFPEPQIILGRGTYFVYLKMEIENVGEGKIEKCKVNGQELEIGQISHNEEKLFYIIISENNKNLPEVCRDITIEFEDAHDRAYYKRYSLLVNVNDRTAKISVKRKQRRKYKNE